MRRLFCSIGSNIHSLRVPGTDIVDAIIHTISTQSDGIV